jgi:hypothetical protein
VLAAVWGVLVQEMIYTWVLTIGEGGKPGIHPLPWISVKARILKRNKCYHI